MSDDSGLPDGVENSGGNAGGSGQMGPLELLKLEAMRKKEKMWANRRKRGREWHRRSAIRKRMENEDYLRIARLELYLAHCQLGVGGQIRAGCARPGLLIEKNLANGDSFILRSGAALDSRDVTILLEILNQYAVQGDHATGCLDTTLSALSNKTGASGQEISANRDALARLSAVRITGKRTIQGEIKGYAGEIALLGEVEEIDGRRIRIPLSEMLRAGVEERPGWLFAGISLAERDMLSTDIARNVHLFFSAWVWKAGGKHERHRRIHLKTLLKNCFPKMDPGWDKDRRRREANRRRSKLMGALREISTLALWKVTIEGRGGSAKALIIRKKPLHELDPFVPHSLDF